ncbi:MAG: DnaA regulatory inactivator Hda [Gammaproteobacteria bacterium]|jgi:DnaA family protein|nr:DnaA regulatory inactivator Hda [Gammaproteobacteria bacterium]
MSTAPEQLCLALRLPEAGGFERFVADGNTAVVTALRHWAADPAAGHVLLHGEAGSGKSHLLHAACEGAAAAGAKARFVPLDLEGLAPSVLEGLEDCDAVVLDAVQAVAGQQDWELGLFNLYNALGQRGGRLLLAARAPAPALGLTLPDLASRLAACATYAVQPLDDAGRARLLEREAIARGLTLSEETLRYILTYSPRDTASLLALVAAVDAASLRLRRAPTPRLVGQLLQCRLDAATPAGGP